MKQPNYIQTPFKTAVKLMAVQSVILVALTLLVRVKGYWGAISFALGAVVMVLPTLWFAGRFFHAWRERSVKQIMISLYMSEVAKLLFCGILAIIFVKYFPVRAGWFILGLAAAYLSFWVAVPFVLKKQTPS